MSIEVWVEDEEGNALAEPVEDSENVLTRLIPSEVSDDFHLLPYIDWYGDTVFNRPQIKRFIEEWYKLYSYATNPSQVELLNRIRALAEFCQSEPHLYLKFYGD